MSLFDGDPDLVQIDDEDASPGETAPTMLEEAPAAVAPADGARLERIRVGLRELIRLAGGEVSAV